MSELASDRDAFGRQLVDFHEGRRGLSARLERDDGWSGPAQPASDFFAGHDDWPHLERELVARAHGRVLDLGAGAGRHALQLQDAGHEVVAVDHSPGAIAVCRARGVRRAQVGDAHDLPDAERFDTVLLLCQNLGIAGTLARTRDLLTVLYGRTRPGAVLLGDTVDPLRYEPVSPHREYHADSPAQGRDVGQVRLRWRYRDLCTPWLDLLLLRRQDLEPVIAGTGWRLADVSTDGAQYGVVLRRE